MQDKPLPLNRRRIGSLEVSVVGLGCNNFGRKLGERESIAVIHAALEAGITFFDTADIYGDTKSETYLGRALGKRRGEVVIASKFGMELDPVRRGARPEYVRQSAEDSLRRLGTDYIDLYQLHQPDPDVPIADTLGALHELVTAGKVREIGCSNFSVDQIREAEAAAGPHAVRFVSVQNEYSLLHREPERDVLPECRARGLAFLPFFPLASGLLTGKYRLGRPAPPGSRLAPGSRYASSLNEHKLIIVEALLDFASRRGRSLVDLAVSWLLMQSVVASVIAGATSPEQVLTNAASASWQLQPSELAEIGDLLSRTP